MDESTIQQVADFYMMLTEMHADAFYNDDEKKKETVVTIMKTFEHVFHDELSMARSEEGKYFGTKEEPLEPLGV